MEPLLQQLLRSELCTEPGHQCRLASLQVGLPEVFIADPDPAFDFNEDSDPDPAFHFDAVPDPYPAPLPCDGNLRFLVCRPSIVPF